LREFSSLEVKVVGNDLEKAMKIPKGKLQKDGVFRRLKAKKSHEKPSKCRRRKRRESERKQRTNRLKSSRHSRYYFYSRDILSPVVMPGLLFPISFSHNSDKI
jgi:small subunit ribosomal protein S21